jgi:very-short-patch-repair endonuclease
MPRKFRRQHSVGPYIVDFYCPSCRLAVELDGQSHFDSTRSEYDVKRMEFLEQEGIRVTSL